MLTAEYNSNSFADVARLSNHELLEVHHSKISIHHAKAGYDPAIRLPFTFSKLAGLPTRIYQTVHDGALAFLVVMSSTSAASESRADKGKNASSGSKSSVFTRRQ
jgi:hypothetical protein